MANKKSYECLVCAVLSALIDVECIGNSIRANLGFDKTWL
jgi:hypothetical protein